MKETKIITAEELKNILREHAEWLETNGDAGMRADLSNVDLRYMDLRIANLRGANLSNAALACADLREANLRGADLSNADLRYVDLRKADLYGTNFYGADLRWADLRYTYIVGTDFRQTDLRYADLRCVDLNIADLTGAKYLIPSVCPEEGSFVAWKKAVEQKSKDYVIVKLQIPEDASRSSWTSRKCRASKVVVLDIQTLAGESLKGATAYSGYDGCVIYKVGETVEPDSFDKNRFNECSNGIHFFVDRQEAVDYWSYTEKGLRIFILFLVMTKKHSPDTKSSMDYIYKANTRTKIDFIYKVLGDKYESGEPYDVSDLYTTVRDFAMNSTHHSKYCLEKVSQMHFKSDAATAS